MPIRIAARSIDIHSQGIKNLAPSAESEKATAVAAVIELYRGFNDPQVSVTDKFNKLGGSEAAPMSTSIDLLVSCVYFVW